MPLWINLVIVLWLLMMGLITNIPYFYMAAVGWSVGYFVFLSIA